MSLRISDINDYVFTSLGFGQGEGVSVELVESDLLQCQGDSLRKYSRQHPLRKRIAQIVPPQRINRYPISPEAYDVIEVELQDPIQTVEAIDSQNFNLFNSFTLINSGYGTGIASAQDYELTLEWRKMTGRVYSLDPDFYFDDDPQPDGETDDIGDYQPRCMYIFNPMGLGIRASWVECSPRPLHKVPPRDEDWILDWATAHAKEILGRKRSKVKTIPMAGQNVELDGEALLLESREDKERLLEDLRQRFIGDTYPIWG